MSDNPLAEAHDALEQAMLALGELALNIETNWSRHHLAEFAQREATRAVNALGRLDRHFDEVAALEGEETP